MKAENAPYGRRARLATVVLAVCLLLLSYPSPTSLPHQLLHNKPVTSTEGLSTLSSALALHPTGEDTVEILADVAVDEDFIARVGDNWESRVRQTVARANTLLAQVGVSIRVASLQQWHSDDQEDSITEDLASAERQVKRGPGNLLVAITPQGAVKYDGWAEERLNRIIIHFYEDGELRNSALLAHEVGHVLGAHHHEDEEECTEEGCIMDREGYAHATTWCHHHRNVIREHLASALAAHRS